jgi:hypothetical protein
MRLALLMMKHFKSEFWNYLEIIPIASRVSRRRLKVYRKRCLDIQFIHVMDDSAAAKLFLLLDQAFVQDATLICRRDAEIEETFMWPDLANHVIDRKVERPDVASGSRRREVLRMRHGSGLEYNEPGQKLRFTFGCYKTDIFRKSSGQADDFARRMRGTSIMPARKRFGENGPVFVPTVAPPGAQPLCLCFF